jgi:hypothetical protein
MLVFLNGKPLDYRGPRRFPARRQPKHWRSGLNLGVPYQGQIADSAFTTAPDSEGPRFWRSMNQRARHSVQEPASDRRTSARLYSTIFFLTPLPKICEPFTRTIFHHLTGGIRSTG